MTSSGLFSAVFLLRRRESRVSAGGGSFDPRGVQGISHGDLHDRGSHQRDWKACHTETEAGREVGVLPQESQDKEVQ